MTKENYKKIVASGNSQDAVRIDTLRKLRNFANSTGTAVESLDIGPVDIIGEYRLSNRIHEDTGILKKFTIRTSDGWINFYNQVESIAGRGPIKDYSSSLTQHTFVKTQKYIDSRKL